MFYTELMKVNDDDKILDLSKSFLIFLNSYKP